tara:strand:- start:533 stop:889 length:357 start_codon:yes stop_codon:yes gene_type:complete
LTKKVKKGDLVCLYRRKHKGIGIVLNKETLNDEKIKIIEIAQKADWKQKEQLKRKALIEAPQRGLIEAAFLYNLWQTNAKLKKDFVYIKWFQCPSEYEQTRTTTDADWFPMDWVGRIE